MPGENRAREVIARSGRERFSHDQAWSSTTQCGVPVNPQRMIMAEVHYLLSELSGKSEIESIEKGI